MNLMINGTVGTAGHVDHGKTELVRALTGVMTDRLPEEQERGLSIVLGYAPLELHDGRWVSLVDVPGHERFVRTMVSGATGIDLFLLAVAADDGVMPQTREHLVVLEGLGIQSGVVAVTKADLADPAAALAEVRELGLNAEAVACSTRTGEGVEELRALLTRAATTVRIRRDGTAPPVMHVDRVFTLPGAGLIVTGTLWRGTIRRGDSLELAGRRVRVRSLQIHDVGVDEAPPGQRVAAALTGVRHREIQPGAVLCAPGATRETQVLDCALSLREGSHGQDVIVHHGTRAVLGRLAELEGELWQLRLESALAAADGDRLVVRRANPPGTLGGGVIIDASARRHGARADHLARLRARTGGYQEPPDRRRPQETPAQFASPPPPDPVLEERLRQAGPKLLHPTDPAERAALAALRDAGRAVRLRGDHFAHHDAIDLVRREVIAAIKRDGEITLGDLRDRLGIARRQAQALLEHLDLEHVTRRLPDDRRVLSLGLSREGTKEPNA
jgi:selenocysteine-specific elongation factor